MRIDDWVELLWQTVVVLFFQAIGASLYSTSEREREKENEKERGIKVVPEVFWLFNYFERKFPGTSCLARAC